jgi:hypothetical protein
MHTPKWESTLPNRSHKKFALIWITWAVALAVSLYNNKLSEIVSSIDRQVGTPMRGFEHNAQNEALQIAGLLMGSMDVLNNRGGDGYNEFISRNPPWASNHPESEVPQTKTMPNQPIPAINAWHSWLHTLKPLPWYYNAKPIIPSNTFNLGYGIHDQNGKHIRTEYPNLHGNYSITNEAPSE